MARTAVEAEVAVPTPEQVHDGGDIPVDRSLAISNVLFGFQMVLEYSASAALISSFIGRRNFVAGIAVFEVARNQNRRGAASGNDFLPQRCKLIAVSVNQG